jgi:hypothetical protein
LSRRADTSEPLPDECLDESAAVAYVQQLMAAEDRTRVEDHASHCEPCRLLLSELLLEGQDVTASTLGIGEGGTRVGRYVVLDCIGLGGMGVVFRAYDPALDRKIALKLMRAEIDLADGHGRVRQEAMALARVSHPNVVTIHDVGEVGAQTYIAMELIEGGSLRDWLAERPRAGRDILAIFRQAGEGLAAAHAAGLVHRDFKPDNLMVHSDGRVRVTDFGLARLRVASERFEVASEVERSREAGTPAYMSPEQRAGGIADQRSDQFSFCLSLQEALLGYRTSGDKRELVSPHGKGRRRVPRWLRSILLRGLSPRPEDRFPSMRALLDSIARAQRWRRGSALVACALVAVAAAAIFEFRILRRRPDPEFKYGSGLAPFVGSMVGHEYQDGWYCGYDPLLSNPKSVRWPDARKREHDNLYVIYSGEIHVVGHCMYGCDNGDLGFPAHCNFAPGIDPLARFRHEQWTLACGGPGSPLGIEAVGVETRDGGTYGLLIHERARNNYAYNTSLVDYNKAWQICR